MFSLFYQDGTEMAYLVSMGISILSGGVLYIAAQKTTIGYISQREGMAIVAIGFTFAQDF